MRLSVGSINMGAAWDIAEKQGPSPGRRSIYLSVFPHDRTHMDLATGEIFENPTYARTRKPEEKAISAVLEIHEASEDNSRKLGLMHYFEAISSGDGVVESASLINFSVQISSKDFSDLIENLRHSVLPTSVSVDLDLNEKGPVKYGWEPDGSGTEWNNKAENARQIPISSVSFRYELLRPSTNDTTGEMMDPPRLTVSETIKTEMKALSNQLAKIGWDLRVAGFAVLIAVVIFILRGNHF